MSTISARRRHRKRQDAAWLSVEVDGKRYTAAFPKDGAGDAASVRYFGHYPIADISYSFDIPLIIQVRAYGVVLPGDAIALITPGIMFDVRVKNTAPHPVTYRLIFGPEKMPASAFSTLGRIASHSGFTENTRSPLSTAVSIRPRVSPNVTVQSL